MECCGTCLSWTNRKQGAFCIKLESLVFRNNVCNEYTSIFNVFSKEELNIKDIKEKKMSKTIVVSDETYDLIKDQLRDYEKLDVSSLQDLVGKKMFFRTVTYHMIGKVEKVIGKIAQLSTASWVADSGRFMNAIKDGTLKEVEPVGDWFVNLDSVTDFGPWVHDLPTKQI